MWHAVERGGFERTSQEAEENAVEIFNLLKSCNFSDNSTIAIIGFIDAVSKLNPWFWGKNRVPTREQFHLWNESVKAEIGYGLFNFIPAEKYIENEWSKAYYSYGPNFADLSGEEWDGYTQVRFVANGNCGWVLKSEFNRMSFNDFKFSEESPEFLVKAFNSCFQGRTFDPTLTIFCVDSAIYWNDFFTGFIPAPTPPDPPDPPEPPAPIIFKEKKWKFYLYD